VDRFATNRLATLAVGVTLLGAVAACQPDNDGGATAGPGLTIGPGATTGVGPVAPIPPQGNVIAGRITLQDGRPVPGASLRIVGYTGGDTLGRDIETVTSGADGTYRYEAASGLYEVRAQGPLTFEGKTYLFNLDPVDGSCDQEMSDDGIVKDFVLRLSGLQQCVDGGVNPDNYNFYHGAAIQLFSGLTTAAPHDVVEYRLEPIGALADGSTGSALVMQRTVAAHTNHFGPIDETSNLYDIPLGRYLVSAALIAPDGARLPLLVSTTGAPAQSVEVAFEPKVVVGTLNPGYSSLMPSVTVQEGG
jgi:hypothetical protein